MWVRILFMGQDIGTELVRRVLARVNHLCAIDLMCDPETQPFYRSLGMRPAALAGKGVVRRN